MFLAGPPDGRQAPDVLQNGQGAEATIVNENAMAPALIASWKGSEIGSGRRKMAGTKIGIEGIGGTGRGDDPAARIETKTGGSVEEVAAAVGTEGVNEKTKTGMEGTIGARGRTGITTKKKAPKGTGPGIKRAGEKMMTGSIKRTGRGTEKRRRQRSRAGVKARRGSIKVVVRRRAKKESTATAKRKTEREMESCALTNVVVAKRGAIISESLVTTIVNIVNGEGVRALSKCPLRAILLLLLCFSSCFLPSCGVLSLVLKRRNVSTSNILNRCRWPM